MIRWHICGWVDVFFSNIRRVIGYRLIPIVDKSSLGFSAWLTVSIEMGQVLMRDCNTRFEAQQKSVFTLLAMMTAWSDTRGDVSPVSLFQLQLREIIFSVHFRWWYEDISTSSMDISLWGVDQGAHGYDARCNYVSINLLALFKDEGF